VAAPPNTKRFAGALAVGCGGVDETGGLYVLGGDVAIAGDVDVLKSRKHIRIKSIG